MHRLKDARTLLGVSEPAALADLAAWRKRVHHVHANSFAQSYMLSSTEWREAKDRTVNIQGKDHSLQHLILQICKRLTAQSDIEWDSEVPKMKRASLTTPIFRDVCVSVVSGAEYVMDLRQVIAKHKGYHSGVTIAPQKSH